MAVFPLITERSKTIYVTSGSTGECANIAILKFLTIRFGAFDTQRRQMISTANDPHFLEESPMNLLLTQNE